MNPENPNYYKVDHRLAVEIWEALYKEGYRYIANSLSETMIEQGCREIEVKDASQVLAFWKDYLEKIDILNLKNMKEVNQQFIDNVNWYQNMLKQFKERKKQNIENRAAFKKHITFFKSYLKDPNRNLDGNKIAVVKDHIKELEEAIDNSKEIAIQIEDNIVQIKNILKNNLF